MASKDVPESLLRSEVPDSGCEVHIADETDFTGYEIKQTEDSKSGRGPRVADGKVTPIKGEAFLHLRLPSRCVRRKVEVNLPEPDFGTVAVLSVQPSDDMRRVACVRRNCFWSCRPSRR